MDKKAIEFYAEAIRFIKGIIRFMPGSAKLRT